MPELISFIEKLEKIFLILWFGHNKKENMINFVGAIFLFVSIFAFILFSTCKQTLSHTKHEHKASTLAWEGLSDTWRSERWTVNVRVISHTLKHETIRANNANWKTARRVFVLFLLLASLYLLRFVVSFRTK